MIHRTTCPVTGTADPEIELIADLPFDQGILAKWAERKKRTAILENQSYRVWRNRKIDFIWQELVLTNEEESDRRTKVRETQNDARPPTLREACHKVEEAILVRMLVDKERSRVLDYGMGLGHWLLAQKAFGAECWGTDIDPLSREVAEANGIQFAELEEMPDASFDFINSDQVFEHLPDPKAHLEKVVAKLAPGGFLKLSTPDDAKIDRRLAKLLAGGFDDVKVFNKEFDALSPLCHINLFSAKSLIALGEECGLESYRLPMKTAYATMTGFFNAKQWNRNLYNPWKRSRGQRSWQYFRKPA